MNFESLTMHYKSLAGESLVDVLRLIRTPNVGPVTFFNLLQRFGNVKSAIDALPELSARGGRKTPLIAAKREDAEKEIAAVQKFGARMVVYGAPEYPKLLQAINDPPPVITVMGHPHLWQQKQVIAMVGARNASANGCQFAQRLARELGEHGYSVASGLARGIDTYVHKGSLAKGTIGVIASGIDIIYPPENEPLYKQIIESGAIISEQPFGQAPFAGSFPGRNRIIAGMSIGTVVVEASPKSGSLITARFAMENNREIFAVPGSPLDPRSKGCNQLIRDGACMVEGVSDIVQGVAYLRGRTLEESPTTSYIEQREPAATDSELAKARAKILEKLGTSAVLVDELIEQCETSAGSMLTVLLELELAGRLKRSPGNKVYLLEILEQTIE